MKTIVNEKPLEDRLAKLTTKQKAKLDDIERHVVGNFTGDFAELEAALGVLRLGHHLGWKVLVLIHNKRTIRKYEEILSINIREFFPEEGPSAYRSNGYRLAMKLGNFWKAVSGDVKVEGRREMGDPQKE